MDPVRRLLLVDLPGVCPNELDPDATPTLWSIVAQDEAATLRRESSLTAADELLATGVVDSIRELGLSLDQRGIQARPGWRTDDGVLSLLDRRPRGPADVTMLRLSDPVRTAAAHGLRNRTWTDALAATDQRLERLIGRLRLDGRTPRVWAMTWGELTDVLRTVDPLGSLRRVLPRSERSLCRGIQSPDALRVRCENGPTTVRVKHWLLRQDAVGSVFDAHAPPPGTALQHGEILALPAAGVAFGSHAVRARLRVPSEHPFGALALDDGMRGTRTLRDLAAHLIFAASEMAAASWPERPPQPAAVQPTVESARSPLEILDAEESVTADAEPREHSRR